MAALLIATVLPRMFRLALADGSRRPLGCQGAAGCLQVSPCSQHGCGPTSRESFPCGAAMPSHAAANRFEPNGVRVPRHMIDREPAALAPLSSGHKVDERNISVRSSQVSPASLRHLRGGTNVAPVPPPAQPVIPRGGCC